MVEAQNHQIYFPILFHFHQPIGNLPWVISKAFNKAYLPLLQTIEKYPHIKVSLHFSGSLLLWLAQYQPGYLETIKNLYSKGQVEIIGGGFYEPIFAIIPREDLNKQYSTLNKWWWENFHIKTHGVWIAERVWSPELTSGFSNIGVKFTFLDDYLFNIAGYHETHYSYVTEHNGEKIIVFPINEQIRYLIPWKEPQETIRYLKNKIDYRGDRVVVLISDAEKMGIWPAGDKTTYDICYVNGYSGKPWLPAFFDQIMENQWIKTVHFNEYLANNSPKGLIYLPTSSYDKMALWVLPTSLRVQAERIKENLSLGNLSKYKDVSSLISGSLWQNFLVKYPESNIMHKRMLFCRAKIIKAESKSKENQELDLRLPEIWDRYLASQANDAYWHGQFGGIYYKFLRHNIHKNLLTAEYILDQVLTPKYEVKVQDILFDGHPDGILENKSISCYISSRNGGSIFCLNLKNRGYNFLNVLTRRKEAYHSHKNVQVIEDRFLKWMFQDHFIPTNTDLEGYVNDTYNDVGNFAGQVYDICVLENSVKLQRVGFIILNNQKIKLTIVKTFSLNKSIIIIDYLLKFEKTLEIENLSFSPEINLICSSYPYKTWLRCNNQKYELNGLYKFNCDLIEFMDLNEMEMVTMKIIFSESLDCITYPINTTLLSEHGFEEQYQGSSLFPMIPIREKSVKFQIRIKLNAITEKTSELDR